MEETHSGGWTERLLGVGRSRVRGILASANLLASHHLPACACACHAACPRSLARPLTQVAVISAADVGDGNVGEPPSPTQLVWHIGNAMFTGQHC